MNSQNAIEIRNMTKFFKIEFDKAHTLKEMLVFWNRTKPEIHTVLKNINLDIKKGQTVALIGTNGCGKSTLLKLMTKIIYPNEGTVTTKGKLTSLLELGAGFHPDFTGRENIYFNASIFGLTKSEIENRLQDIIDFSELEEFIDQPVRTYSSGMYMRLAFSIAINVDAEILLIDEILAVGDQNFQEKCFTKLRELRDSNRTIVIVSHNLDSVKDLCERAIWIYKGEVKMDDAPNIVIENYLKQVTKDRKEQSEKAKANGALSYNTFSCIDSPTNDVPELSSEKYINFTGWTVSSCINKIHKVVLDDKELDNLVFNNVSRQDVYEAYYNDFAEFIDVNTTGWTVKIPTENIKSGTHVLTYKCVSDEGKVLIKKDVTFTVI